MSNSTALSSCCFRSSPGVAGTHSEECAKTLKGCKTASTHEKPWGVAESVRRDADLVPGSRCEPQYSVGGLRCRRSRGHLRAYPAGNGVPWPSLTPLLVPLFLLGSCSDSMTHGGSRPTSDVGRAYGSHSGPKVTCATSCHCRHALGCIGHYG